MYTLRENHKSLETVALQGYAYNCTFSITNTMGLDDNLKMFFQPKSFRIAQTPHLRLLY